VVAMDGGWNDSEAIEDERYAADCDMANLEAAGRRYRLLRLREGVMVKPWLWPDHVIGKRESRRLREEHNAAVNDCADLLAAGERMAAVIRMGSIDNVSLREGAIVLRVALDKWDAAIAKAEGR
jgi:hypothetical protein